MRKVLRNWQNHRRGGKVSGGKRKTKEEEETQENRCEKIHGRSAFRRARQVQVI